MRWCACGTYAQADDQDAPRPVSFKSACLESIPDATGDAAPPNPALGAGISGMAELPFLGVSTTARVGACIDSPCSKIRTLAYT